MKPYEFIKTIQSKKTEKAIISILKTIPAESDFWTCIHYALTPFIPWGVKLSFTNPKIYGSGVPEGVFEKIISAMENESLSAEDTAFALSKFSAACGKTEWNTWYLPTLNKTLVVPFGADTFNTVCPDRFVVCREWKPVPTRLVTEVKKLPREFHIEPSHKQNSVYLFCEKDSVRVFHPDGSEFFHNITTKLHNIADEISGGLVLVGYLDAETLMLNDVFTKDEFIRCDKNSLKFKIRREILENIVGSLHQDNIAAVESYPVDRNDKMSVINEINLLMQAGYNGFVFRDANQCCGYPDIMAEMSTKSVLTCVGITPGKDNYSKMTEFISGRGVLNKKKIQVKVFLGLTLAQKEQYLKDSDSLIGERFEVVSCGLRHHSEEMLFPIFNQWRKK